MKNIEEIVANHKARWIAQGWSQSKINTHEYGDELIWLNMK